MNDFTKEELKMMAWGIDILMDQVVYGEEKKSLDCLHSKLNSMIDSLCENKVMTAEMKEYQSICAFNENGKTYFTLISDIFPCGTHSSLDMAMKIICLLGIGGNKFSNEWIDRIIFRLQELKNE